MTPSEIRADRAVPPATATAPGDQTSRPRGTSRRRLLQAGLGGLAGLAGGSTIAWLGCGKRPGAGEENVVATSADVFPGDAPQGQFWEAWQKQGWLTEARHYLKLGRNVQCKTCPNQCLLEPEDRSHCRTRVNKDGTLYSLAYGNPCAVHIDPIEKKPLFHFLPGTEAFSLAIAGCVFRCLNCQNWDISQKKPDETKDPGGEPVRARPETLSSLALADVSRLSMFPEDVVALAAHFRSASIAYTYSEPIAWFEYLFDTSKLARQKNIKNLWITCGSIQEEPLVELCGVIDAANVNLKSYDEEVYERLNAGRLAPILNTLTTLKREGVWLEVTNLVVPTYTDDREMIRRMCGWLLDNLGPDYPLHFSRFHPQHKLTHLPPTPIDVLVEAREIARRAGLHYVYIGNAPQVEDGETTFCPGCKRAVIERTAFLVRSQKLTAGKCSACGTAIAGVWA
jgi:pyruvate formate lyase activating enzyme